MCTYFNYICSLRLSVPASTIQIYHSLQRKAPAGTVYCPWSVYSAVRPVPSVFEGVQKYFKASFWQLQELTRALQTFTLFHFNPADITFVLICLFCRNAIQLAQRNGWQAFQAAVLRVPYASLGSWLTSDRTDGLRGPFDVMTVFRLLICS